MNIEELRKALASDATEKVKEQEKTIQALEKQLEEAENIIKVQYKVLRVMCNRCIVMTRGAMCLFCGHAGLCEDLRNTDNGNKTAP
ncbi:MAG: hypothetical protein IKT98_03890 [Selenomonadaceae bacterium]|nr:hypothetical protein [Selenomonadaceae bacterium]